MAIITIATDYGTTDGYAAAVKGIIKSLNPDVDIVDVTDNLTTILKTSLVLFRYYSCYPQGAVHLVINDPTVGTARRALTGTDGRCFFVGPDNGVFSHIIQSAQRSQWHSIEISKLPPREIISSTFHGRDIFAPAAALLSLGKLPEELGPRIADPVTIEIPAPSLKRNLIIGEVIDIDSFGNLIINISRDILKEIGTVSIKGENMSLKKKFSDVPPRFPVAYIGSMGYLEIAINQGQASKFFNAQISDKVEVISDLPCL